MNPTPGEQAMYDHEAVADLQWAGNDIEGAKALLDEAGIVDTDGDGYEYNGENLSYVATCPNGWSDWQAAIEVVAAAGAEIGIDITDQLPMNGRSINRGDEVRRPAAEDWRHLHDGDGAGPPAVGTHPQTGLARNSTE